jgi:hypothetical protein
MPWEDDDDSRRKTTKAEPNAIVHVHRTGESRGFVVVMPVWG